MPHYKLTYFNSRGRAEAIRYIFAVVGVPYEDCRIEGNWPEVKPTTPWGQLPVLEVDGRQLGQSLAICKYLADMFGLDGEDSYQQALVSSVAFAFEDLLGTATVMYFEKDEARKAVLKEELATQHAPGTLDAVNKFLEAREGDWLVGNKMTWADLYFRAMAELFMNLLPNFLEKHPKLQALFDRVGEHPKIAAWISKRPASEN